MYFSLLRPALGVIAIFILLSVMYPLVKGKNVQCANTISCKETLKYEVKANLQSTNSILGAKTSSGQHIFVIPISQALSVYEGIVNFIISSFIRIGTYFK